MATNQTAIWAAVVPWSGVQNPPTASPNVLGLVQPNGVATDYLDGSGNWSVPPSGAGGVTQLTPGPGISLNPPGGVGIVEITATASGGNVTGPAGATSGNFAAFNGGTGLLLEDSGKSAASFLGATAEAADVNPSGTNIAAALAGKQAAGAAAGGDLGGNYPNPKVVAVTETGGPTDLVIGSVPDGTYLKRSGGTVIGGTPTGSGNVTGPSVSVDGDIAVYSGTSGEIIKDTGLKAASFDAAGSAATAQSNAETYAAAQAAAAQTAAEAYAANSSNQSSGTLNASRLPASGVSAGSYTNTNLTVDATGRITAANSGSAGSGLPAGGATFQRLAKNSAANYDVGWYGPYEFNVKDCGAKGDGSTDDTAAINNAITALNGAGSGQLVFPAGTYKITAALTTITVPCGIVGQGGGVSIINTTSGSANVFTITTTGQCVIRDIGITGSSTGYGISFNASGGGNGSSIVDGVSVSGFARGLDASNSNNMVVNGCVLQSNTIGLYYNNSSSANPDAGGGFVSDTLFLSNTYGIYQLNNGGETISNCQFHNNQWHIYVTLTGATYGNSDTKITGCWLDQWKYAAIHFDQGDSSPLMSNVCITGNSFSALDTAGMAGQNVIEVIGTASNFGQNWVITGNQFQYAEQASGDAIHLVNCTQFNISGNQFFEVGGYSGHAIYIESNCSLIAWDPHQLFDNSNGAPVVDNQTFPSVSSASTITLPTWGTYCKVTGSTAVSTINGGWQGRQIALLCPSGVAFNTGGNIAGAVTVAAGRQVSLTFDGTSWYPD